MFTEVKDFIVVGLCSLSIILALGVAYFSQRESVETKTIKVPVERINYNIEDVKEWMLRVGVSDAWVSLDQVHMRKADCFTTVMFTNGSVLSYCELRR